MSASERARIRAAATRFVAHRKVERSLALAALNNGAVIPAIFRTPETDSYLRAVAA